MGDEEEPQCKVEYLDLAEGAEPEETNWIRRAGRCRVTYVNGCTFEGKNHLDLYMSLVSVWVCTLNPILFNPPV
jgi:hypothetical protein